VLALYWGNSSLLFWLFATLAAFLDSLSLSLSCLYSGLQDPDVEAWISFHDVSVLLVNRRTCLDDLTPNLSLMFNITLPLEVEWEIS